MEGAIDVKVAIDEMNTEQVCIAHIRSDLNGSWRAAHARHSFCKSPLCKARPSRHHLDDTAQEHIPWRD